MKTKFVGLLRGLLHRFDENGVNVVELPRPITAAPLTEPPPVVTAQPQPVFASPSTPAESQRETDELELPLQSVLAALPMDLRAKLMQAPPAGATMIIAIEKILSQLANGSVKISFGELRLAAPSLFANSGGENDSRPVTLPLNEILVRLNPALLSRHSTQKKFVVANDVTGPFDGRGQGITFTTAPLKTAPSPTPAPAPRTGKPVSWPAVPPHPLTPQPSFASRAITPMPANATAAPITNGPIPRNGASRFNSVAPVPPMTPAAHPTILPEHAHSTVFAPLATLSAEWPEALRLEIAQTNLTNAQVALPTHLVEPALKRGRVIFSWRYVRSWIRPVPPGVSVHDGIELELPLKVIAPLFFGLQKNVARLQRKTILAPEIPDLFFGFPQPQSQPDTSVLQREQTAPRPETARYAPKPADTKPADTNFYIWSDHSDTPMVDEDEIKRPATPPTDFTSRRAMPKDVVARAMELPGVAGALVALQDGLKVASQVPVDLNADTLAAFLPQIFDRLGQSTRELRMGALNNVNFTVGNVPWKIYRVNSVYFAAFGRPGEALPTAQLALLAAELDRKKP
ncbi:MAG: roadblock/LC7 domain-containing protein [Verrucomicrobiota bacterium]|jgi:predicted regulator of Ras-like GTPase activity (Roadblock/LC7/MglB family)